MISGHTRIIDIKPGNRVKTVKKLESGDLEVTQHSGNVFTIKKDNPDFQAFVVYSVLYEL